jgi:PAS domain S-box-containing protein
MPLPTCSDAETLVAAYGDRLFWAAGDGLILHDAVTSVILTANRAAWSMHGCECAEFVGRPLRSFVQAESRPHFDGYCSRVHTEGEDELQAVFLREFGLPFVVELHGTAFPLDGRPTILSVVRNVSTRVAMQRQLDEHVAAMHEQAQAVAILAERQRLAQELHDAVNQSLFTAGLIAEVLPNLWARSPLEGQQALEDLRRLTRGALAEMRMLLAELRPLALSHTDLGELLRLLGNALAGRTNIPVQVTVAGTGTLPADVQVAFYRLCQEALTNIAKHAEASEVEVELRIGEPITELRVHDNGCGFDPAHTPSGHYGLSMMRERADSVHAQLAVTSVPGVGTEVVVRWPREQGKAYDSTGSADADSGPDC